MMKIRAAVAAEGGVSTKVLQLQLLVLLLVTTAATQVSVLRESITGLPFTDYT